MSRELVVAWTGAGWMVAGFDSTPRDSLFPSSKLQVSSNVYLSTCLAATTNLLLENQLP